jgi:hypothetical protein
MRSSTYNLLQYVVNNKANDTPMLNYIKVVITF